MFASLSLVWTPRKESSRENQKVTNTLLTRKENPLNTSKINTALLLLCYHCSIPQSSTTVSNNCASISLTKNCNNSSIITCSFWNKKNTNARASNGPSLISAWICNCVLIWSKRYRRGYHYLADQIAQADQPPYNTQLHSKNAPKSNRY